MNPKISIIVPVYNVENYIDDCVNSILSQGNHDIEIILVDDGSTDSSGDICDRIKNTNSLVSVVHKTNGGLSSARNLGLKYAKGEYVFFVDSDDYIVEGSLKALCECIDNNNHPDVIKFNYIRYDKKNNKKYTVNSSIEKTFYPNQKSIYSSVIPQLLAPGSLLSTGATYGVSVWSHIYKKDLLDKNKIVFVSEREISSEDILFNFQVLRLAETYIAINNSVYVYILRNGSLTQKYIPDKFQKKKLLYRKLREEIIANGYNELLKYVDLYFLRASYYDCIANECNKNPKLIASLLNVRDIIGDSDFQRCLRCYAARTEKGEKERIICTLLKRNYFFLIFLLKRI
ncbi:glycosyltransferase family 2 protein [Bifidobacterium simiiventris]|uniref:glycosyltransferase family 2 protein n=1 Tax=Bifidobacterium simiiventris TaxID=2834434 RepID=UPI001C57B42B|nr:glycosyltransferase [Bifidobacterium simiiventris]MBW3078677.1 glycosyltransferase [Bifidobacterium simiiventris]